MVSLLKSGDIVKEAAEDSCWKKCCQTCCYCFYKDENEDIKVPRRERRGSVALAQKTLRKMSEASENVPERPRGVASKFMTLTFVPDFIIKEIFNDSFQKLPAVISSDVVLLIADVCGFTSLCESYCQKGVSGIEELAYVLNGFMSTLSAMLISGGGDILNFAGDAFLVQWIEDKEGGMQTAVQKAYQCAVSLQTHECLRTKNLNGTLKVKIGIAMGNITTWVLGTDDFLLFAVAGRTVPVVNKAEEYCGPGEIAVSDEVFSILKETNTNVFNTKELDDGFIKITGYESPEDDSEPMPDRFILFEECEEDHIMKSKIFLTPSVRGIKSSDELEYISELTMVTILFISLMNVEVAKPEVLGDTFHVILASVKKFEGVLNKMLLFDKGCTYLVAFGLPGLKHSNDAARGIYCAEDVVAKLGQMNIRVAVGVSSGTCFCGIVGHPQRQEYTAIGSRVNMAARIMVVYNDEAIAMNVDTYHLCRDEIGLNNFVELPARKMKGIESAGAIYAYRKQETKRKESLQVYDIVEDSDLHGSQKERERIKNCVAAMQNDDERADMKKNKLLPVLIIKGQSSSGKSFLIYLAVDFGISMGYKVVVCCAIQSYFSEPFFVISRLMMRMLEITMAETSFERQKILLAAVSNCHHPDLYFLNHLFHVNFPVPDNVPADTAYRIQRFSKLAKHIMQQNKSALIAVDNADYMDDESWYLIHELAEEEDRVFLVLSVCLDFKEVNMSASVLLLKAYMHINLESVEADYFAPLMCWFLGVKAVHTTLFVYLKELTDGKAQLLKEVSLSSAIYQCIRIVPFTSLDEERLKREFYINTFEALLDDEPLACDLKPEVDLRVMNIPKNMNDAVKEKMNNLNIQDRLLLKRAAVLGADFNLHTLDAISTGMGRAEVLQCINNLLVNDIFASVCTMENVPDETTSESATVMLDIQNICFCFNVYLKLNLKHKQATKWSINPYHRLKFRTHDFRSSIIAYMTKEQLYNMRMEVANDLEMSASECAFCRARRIEGIEIQKVAPIKRQSFSSQKQKCVCLDQRPKLYAEISALYKSIGMFFQPVYYERKAAQAANDINYPILALNYIRLAQGLMPQCELLSEEEKKKEEAYFDPIILEVSLKKTTALSFLLLGDTYTAVSYLSQAFHMLDIDIICFHGVFSAREFKKILPRFPLLHAEYITKLIGVLAKTYMQSGIYELAFEIITIEFVALSLYPIDFLQVLTHMILLYQCKYRIHQRKKMNELESNIFRLCQEKLSVFNVLLDLTEVHAIGTTFILIAETNFVLGNLERAQSIANDGITLLNSINNARLVPRIKILVFHINFHSKKYRKCFETLTDVNEMEALGHSTYALCICGFILIFMKLQDVSELVEIEGHIKCCDDFASAWNWERLFIEHKDFAFYISVCLTQWCMYSDENTGWLSAKSVFKQCYNMSESLHKAMHKTKHNYWIVSGSLLFMDIKLRCLKKGYKGFAVDIDAIREELNFWKNVIKLDYPVYLEVYERLAGNAQEVQTAS